MDSSISERCDICQIKLNYQRMYVDGKKLCPACQAKKIAEMQNPKTVLISWFCSRCGELNSPTSSLCVCGPENTPIQKK